MATTYLYSLGLDLPDDDPAEAARRAASVQITGSLRVRLAKANVGQALVLPAVQIAVTAHVAPPTVPVPAENAPVNQTWMHAMASEARVALLYVCEHLHSASATPKARDAWRALLAQRADPAFAPLLKDLGGSAPELTTVLQKNPSATAAVIALAIECVWPAAAATLAPAPPASPFYEARRAELERRAPRPSGALIEACGKGWLDRMKEPALRKLLATSPNVGLQAHKTQGKLTCYSVPLSVAAGLLIPDEKGVCARLRTDGLGRVQITPGPEGLRAVARTVVEVWQRALLGL